MESQDGDLSALYREGMSDALIDGFIDRLFSSRVGKRLVARLKEEMKPEVQLYYTPSMQGLAERVVSQCARAQLGCYYWNEFDDKFPDYRIARSEGIRKKKVCYLMDLSDREYILHQLGVAYALPHRGAQEVQILLPYYPTATLERGDSEGHIISAKVLARMISATPMSRSGPVEYVLWDVHTLSLKCYFGDNVITRYKSFTKYLKYELASWETRPMIVYPDEGSYKRFRFAFDGGEKSIRDVIRRKLQLGLMEADDEEVIRLLMTIGEESPKFDTAVFSKDRLDGDGRDLRLVAGDPAGRDCVIVDDLTRTAGTLLGCTDALFKAGAASVSVAIAHGAWGRTEKWKRLLDRGIRKVFVSDSIPSAVSDIYGVDPFQVISLDRSIAHVVED